MSDSEENFERIQQIKTRVMIAIAVFLVICVFIFLFITIKDRNKDKELVDNNYEENQKKIQQVIRDNFADDLLEDNVFIISLKSMYENGVLDKLETSYKEECIDFASYAKVTKLEDKYQLDIVLVCGEKSETLTSYYDLECGLSCDEIE